jgi:hypothetical protein
MLIQRAQIRRFLVLALRQSQQLVAAEAQMAQPVAVGLVGQAAAALGTPALPARLLGARGHLVKAIRAARDLQQILALAAAAARLLLDLLALVRLAVMVALGLHQASQGRPLPTLAVAAAAQTQIIARELAARGAVVMVARLAAALAPPELQIQAVVAAAAETMAQARTAAQAVLASSSCLCPLLFTAAPQPDRPPSLPAAQTPL